MQELEQRDRYDEKYFPVFQEIDRALSVSESRLVIIAIDGRCGSGKTTLGNLLQEAYSCRLFHMDDFFLRPEQRSKMRMEEVGGNVDYERFQTEILAHLGDGNGLWYQRYDCGCQCLEDGYRVPYTRLNIIEGAYSQHPYLGDIYDKRFFLDIIQKELYSSISSTLSHTIRIYSPSPASSQPTTK